MQSHSKDMDVAKNIRAIDWLKAELASSVGSLFRAMHRGGEDLVCQSLANILVIVYLLSRRLGIGFARLDQGVEKTLGSNLEAGHSLEKWYGDLTALRTYIAARKGD